jgi:hypothetical protein
MGPPKFSFKTVLVICALVVSTVLAIKTFSEKTTADKIARCVVETTTESVNQSGMSIYSPKVRTCKFVELEGVQDGGAFICGITLTHPETKETKTIVNPGVEGKCLGP